MLELNVRPLYEERGLLRDGYLAVSSKPVRSFHEDGRVVDLTVKVDKGEGVPPVVEGW